MTAPLIISTNAVRDYLELNTPGSTSKYSDATIGSNIRSALWYLEHKTGRFLCDHPATTWVIPGATMLQAQVALPGFRSFTSVTWGGTSLVVGFQVGDNGSCWALPDQLNTGVYVALQFRAWRMDLNSDPWARSYHNPDPNWWNKLLDSPFYPGNVGGGYAWTSMPDDLVIVGDGGYAAGTEPDIVLHVVKVLAAFYTMRPASILADVAITPAGGVLNYSRMPAEVVDFIADWKLGGQQVVSM